ncbi:unnamed protein product [Closterium sp. NIES-65]|nr:unnamed protein product [Closterium sp. NIES-65]
MAAERAMGPLIDVVKEAVLAAVREELAAHKEEVNELRHMLTVAEQRNGATTAAMEENRREFIAAKTEFIEVKRELIAVKTALFTVNAELGEHKQSTALKSEEAERKLVAEMRGRVEERERKFAALQGGVNAVRGEVTTVKGEVTEQTLRVLKLEAALKEALVALAMWQAEPYITREWMHGGDDGGGSGKGEAAAAVLWHDSLQHGMVVAVESIVGVRHEGGRSSTRDAEAGRAAEASQGGSRDGKRRHQHVPNLSSTTAATYTCLNSLGALLILLILLQGHLLCWGNFLPAGLLQPNPPQNDPIQLREMSERCHTAAETESLVYQTQGGASSGWSVGLQ